MAPEFESSPWALFLLDLKHKHGRNPLAENKRIIDWIVRHGTRGVNNIGRLMNEYYLNYDNFIQHVDKDMKPEKLIG